LHRGHRAWAKALAKAARPLTYKALEGLIRPSRALQGAIRPLRSFIRTLGPYKALKVAFKALTGLIRPLRAP